MTSRRKSASYKKAGPDDLLNRHIRFDYSDTYLDNEDLDLDLEDQEYQLKRERLRKTVENEEVIKKAKQDADEMLQLKNALKNRDPNESSKRVSKSADLNRRQTNIGQSQVNANEKTSHVNKEHKTNDGVEAESGEVRDLVDGVTFSTHNPSPRKQINNLTMFLLSLQKLKGCGFRQRLAMQEKLEDKRDTKVDQNAQHNQQHQWPNESKGTVSRARPSSLRSVTSHGGNFGSRRESASAPRRASSQYGIHVKKDFTRSRRELEEISRIEQDAKYGYVNKYEERRKRLLDSCKNTGHLERRIGVFLKDVDDFKSVTSNINSLDKVMSRSKSAQLSRVHTTLW